MYTIFEFVHTYTCNWMAFSYNALDKARTVAYPTGVFVAERQTVQ